MSRAQRAASSALPQLLRLTIEIISGAAFASSSNRPTRHDACSLVCLEALSAGLPVVPGGAGTGLSGGAVAGLGGVVVALTRMKRILEINSDNPLITGLVALLEAKADEARIDRYVDLVHAQALLAEGSPPENPAELAKSFAELLTESVSRA